MPPVLDYLLSHPAMAICLFAWIGLASSGIAAAIKNRRFRRIMRQAAKLRKGLI